MVRVLRAREPLVEVLSPYPFAEVLPELLLRRHEQHVAVLRLVDLVANALAHPGRPRRTAAVVVRLVAGDLRLWTPVGLVRLRPVPIERSGRVRLRDLELHTGARLTR